MEPEIAQTLIPLLAVLILTGVFAGLLAGLLGVGGGIVVVPMLFFVLQSFGFGTSISMQIAVGTSLLTIVPTSMSSALAHHRRGNVDIALARFWMMPMILGALTGSWVAIRVDGLLLAGLFGVVALLMAANMLRRSFAKARSQPSLSGSTVPAKPIQAMIACLTGVLCVMMGIGGGTFGVTALSAFKIPIRRAVGTSALFGVAIAAPGALTMSLAGYSHEAPLGTVGLVNLPAFFVLSPVTWMVAPIGVKLGAKLAPQTLTHLFAAFLILVGLRMIWQLFTR